MLCLLCLKDGDGNQVHKLKHHFGVARGDVASSLITWTPPLAPAMPLGSLLLLVA